MVAGRGTHVALLKADCLHSRPDTIMGPVRAQLPTDHGHHKSPGLLGIREIPVPHWPWYKIERVSIARGK